MTTMTASSTIETVPDLVSSSSSSSTCSTFESDLSAAGWRLDGTPGQDKVIINSTSIIEVKRLQEAFARIVIDAELVQQPYRKSLLSNSSSSSLEFAPSRHLYSLINEQSFRDRNAVITPLLSPLLSYNSFTSSPPSSVGGDQTPASSTSRSSQLLRNGSQNSDDPKRRTLPSTKKTKSVQFSDVEFSTEDISNEHLSHDEAVDILIKEFPALCEAPARMYGSDGQPLPPTKKQEISDAEREARKNAIRMENKGNVSHCLLKVSVLLETRHIIWRRIEGMTSIQQRPAAQALDEAALDPWLLQLNHGDIDIDEMARKKLRKMFELNNNHKVGQCDGCRGSTIEACQRCKGALPDECWWCKGSGRTSGEECRQCVGEGVMTCRACQGDVAIPCSRCHGQGRCLYAAFLQVSMARVDLAPVSISSIKKVNDDRSIADICSDAARSMVAHILDPSKEDDKTIEKVNSRPSRAHRIRATLQSSCSNLVRVEIPQAGRLIRRKGSEPASLRPSNFFRRRISFLPVYFIIPSDKSLLPVQLSAADFQAALFEKK